MKFKLSIIIFFISIIANANDDLKLAEKAYDTKNYKEAIEKYEALVSSGYKAYQLYFNLGNAYYKNNQIGKAIYNYELARKINPNDEDVKINLAIANSKTIDKIDTKENFFVTAVKTNLLLSLSTAKWAWLSIFALMLALILTYIFIFSQSVPIKRISFIAGILSVIAFIFMYALGFSALKSKVENKFAVITSKQITVKNEPTLTGSSRFTLHEGTKIRVIENNGEWVLIKLDNGNEGWLKLADVGIL
ncbi:MAG: tetratricopeptide repeat protein [Bacteroidetes bacterium]|nr:tetratricopeptide repeat protein [Bacteroidota bacterium]